MLSAVKMNWLERRHDQMVKLCSGCIGPQYHETLPLKEMMHHQHVPCETVGCPVYYERVASSRHVVHGGEALRQVHQALGIKTAGYCW